MSQFMNARGQFLGQNYPLLGRYGVTRWLPMTAFFVAIFIAVPHATLAGMVLTPDAVAAPGTVTVTALNNADVVEGQGGTLSFLISNTDPTRDATIGAVNINVTQSVDGEDIVTGPSIPNAAQQEAFLVPTLLHASMGTVVVNFTTPANDGSGSDLDTGTNSVTFTVPFHYAGNAFTNVADSAMVIVRDEAIPLPSALAMGLTALPLAAAYGWRRYAQTTT
jgi:hypothetical protein